MRLSAAGMVATFACCRGWTFPPVRSGPYRWLTHPNYVAVVLEGVALPMVHACWITAAVFTVANAALLTVRIRTENVALAGLPRVGVPADA